VSATRLTNAYWYLDTDDMLLCVSASTNVTATTNRGFIPRWDKLNASKEIQLFGRLHSELFNRPLVLLPGVSLQNSLTKDRPSFYMISKEADSKTTFNFLDAHILVTRIKPDPVMWLAHTSNLNTAALARYNMTIVEFKIFPFSAGSKSLYIDNAVLGPVPQRLLFSMVKNVDFIGSHVTNPYGIQHYNISIFRCLRTENSSLTEACLWAWIIKRPP